MSQYDFGNLESPLPGSTFINTHVEPWRDAVHSNHKDNTRPTYVAAGMMWIDDTTTPWIVNFFDGTDDIPAGTINPATNIFTPSGAGAIAFTGNNTHSGTETFSNAAGVTTNTITERTAAAGVTIDGILLKDGGATFTAVTAVESGAAFVGASSSDTLLVSRNGSCILNIQSPNSSVVGVYFSDPDDRDVGGVVYDHADDSLNFRINNSQRVSIDSSGIMDLGGGLSIAGGAQITKLLTATAALNFPSIAANSTESLTMTVSGAVVGDTVILEGYTNTVVDYSARVSGSNTVTVYGRNISTSPVDPASTTFRATVVGVS
jgi:hypothetical protein